MALIEKLQRRIIDLGLLPRLIASLPRLSLVCAMVGICWLTVFIPMEGQYRRTYISENALMPSQAYSYFRETEWNILRGYRTQVQLLQSVGPHQRNEEISAWLQEFGVKTATFVNEEGKETLYGILNAPRGDGTEAMVLAAPWFNGDDEANIGGTALTISLARFFNRWPVWSKNIILVFSEDANATLRSWVEAYHTSLDLTGGSIESAVVLDYPGANDFFKYVEIYYAGLNGELPNLDMVNIAVHITEHEGMKVSLNGIPEEQLDQDDFYSKLKTLMRGVKFMALAGARKVYGNEAFSGWRIQSITLRARGEEGPFDITTFGRIPEAIFRSVNNLLEKFHQSFFFYLLLAPRYFVSIATYLPAAIALSVSFTLASLNNLLNNSYSSASLLSLYNIWGLLALSVALAISYIIAQLLAYAQHPQLLVLSSFVVSFIPILLKNVKIMAPFAYRCRAFAYLYLSIILTSLLVVNFALAFSIGTLAFPMTLVKNSVTSKLRLKNCLLLLLSNPFISIWIFGNLVDDQLGGIQMFYGFISAWKNLGCWTWFIICIGWLPAWLLVAYSSIATSSISIVDESQIEAVKHKKTL
ncbi:LAFE_0H09472g1_1 [Lachancea fermentati]|uniref:LAFE_0H09472g1_1 n=1 Tax=Lachancea fermentati TaxID=4955 RepID=A0A1G4MK32_LACFM|nr:LAFE_0H09472g1_1 [Lachancea fermentati]